MPILEIDAKKAENVDMQKAVEEYPGLFKIENGKLAVDDIYRACTFGKAIEQDLNLRDAVKVSWDESQFVFKYETDGSLTARQVLDKAVEILESKANEFSAAIDEAEF